MSLQRNQPAQVSGQVSSQNVNAVPAVAQQNGDPPPSQLPNPNAPQNFQNTSEHIANARRSLQNAILALFMERRQQFRAEPSRKLLELVRRLEDSLFKSATGLEEYLDRKTLPSRLQVMVRRMHMNNMNHQLSHANSSVPVGTMIPTPGFQQTGESNLDAASSVDSSLVPNNISNRIASSTVNSGSLLPTRHGTSGSVQGALVSGYQPLSPAVSADAIRNAGVQKLTSQMIPTPGLNNSNDQEVNSPVNNIHTSMNLGSSSNIRSSPTVNSSAASQPLQPGQHVSVGRGNLSPNLGGNLTSGDQSLMQRKTYGSSNGAFAGGLGMMRNNTSIMNGAGTTRAHIPVTTSLESTTTPNLDNVSVHSMSNTNNPSMNNNQPNLYTTEQANSAPGHHVPQDRQYQHVSNQFQGQQLDHNPVRQSQRQLLSKGDTSGRSNLAHNLVTESGEGALRSQISNPIKSSDANSQFQRLNSMTDHSGATRILSQPSLSRNTYSTSPQTSVPMQQLLHPRPLDVNSQGDTGGIKPDMEICGGENDAMSQNLRTSPLDSNIHDVVHSGSIGPEKNLSSQEQGMGQPHKISETEGRSCDENRERQYRNQQKWLLFLRHARRCSAPEGECQDPNCSVVQKLLKHMEHCNAFQCSYPRCRATRILINHHRRCQELHCPVCIPVKNFVQAQLRSVGCAETTPGLANSILGRSKSHDRNEIGETAPTSCSVIESTDELHPSVKRMKIEQGSQSHVSENETAMPLDPQNLENKHNHQYPENTEIPAVKVEVSESAELIKPVKRERLDDKSVQGPQVDLIISNNPSGSKVKEVVQTPKELGQVKPDNASFSPETCSKSGKPNITGVSLIELFTPEQVHQHIMSLRQWIGQSKAKAEKHQAMEHSMSENSCQLCAVEKLTFEPPPIYCTPCGARVKRNSVYYSIGTGETRHCFCAPCFNETRGERVMVDGNALPKARAEKKKNDEEIQEWWVQCDKCELWQHQICALFNGRRNDGGQAEYTCPNCYVAEIERGERVPLPQSAVLGAKDLPRTNLSDHLEQHLFAKLQQERQERARAQGRSYSEVPGAEELVVRVVSSVDKRLDVKPRFLGIFQEENYAKEFPYKSKVVLLFQKIEGVEVCLFGMYVQEYGSDCQQPNHRRVYLAYLDSVKYFRPDVKAVTGEALRTFVYHEILIGYLEHCKMRGFTSCYIWACPPLKGEDYILYCHPEIQKTPKSDKLREWYLAMLRKATKENVVVELTNMYEHFFVSSGECKAKVTAARLPYFDGDYWPGAAEDIIYQLQEVEDGKKPVKKGNFKKTITKRTLKASGQTDLSGNASKDLLLMQKLGETISPMKDDFIMVHLQHSCTHCCILIASGNRWVCEQCKSFNLCDKCYDAEIRRDHRERHPINQRDKHTLHPVEVTGVPDETNDAEIVESEFFDTRQAFLGLCQGNHYQYDTLRRAKHSSMMVLYHLHNPTAPAFVTACSVCHNDIEAGQGWRCETCPDYEACNACYQKDGLVNHPHKLIKPSSDNNAQNKEARQLRVMQLKKMLELLVHASRCRSPHCQYPNCRKVKALFRHGMGCKKRASGGCVLCKKMWHLLQLHARACKESECTVPRCSDLKEHLRRLQQQSDTRRRAAVNEMMRQRIAEVAGKS